MSPEAPRPRLALVAAVAANGVIGRGGGLAWHLPDDLRHFKQLTLGHPILMGRRTFESIGRALPGRRNVVISATLASPPAPGVEVAPSLDAALALLAGSDRVFVIGGAVLYEATLPRADVLHVTELDDPVDGDTFFPAWDKSGWRVVDEVRHERDERHAHAFHFRTYARNRTPS